MTAVFLFIFATPLEHFFQSTMVRKENPTNVQASKLKNKFNIRYKLIEIPTLPLQNNQNITTYNFFLFFVNMQKRRIASIASGGDV